MNKKTLKNEDNTENKNKYGLKNIVIRNIWYMLAYCTDCVEQFDIDEVDLEDIQSTNELVAVLLCKVYEDLRQSELETCHSPVPKLSDKPSGKLDIMKSYRTGEMGRGRLYGTSNIEDPNCDHNKIIKAAFKTLIEYNDESLDKIREQTVERLKENFNTLEEAKINNIELDIDVFNRVGNPPQRYESIWTVIAILLYMITPIEHNRSELDGHTLLGLDNVNKLSVIFEKFGYEVANKEYTRGMAVKPVYNIKGIKGGSKGTVRQNRLDLLIKNKTNVAVIDFKFYDTTVVGKDDNNSREVLDYGSSFFENDPSKNKYDSINCVLVYAHKDAISKSILSTVEPRNMAGKTGTIYRRSVDLNQEPKEIIRKLIEIYDEALCIDREETKGNE